MGAAGGAGGGGAGRNIVKIDIIGDASQLIATLNAVKQQFGNLAKGSGGGATSIQSFTQAQTNLNSAVAAGVGPIRTLNNQVGTMSSTMQSSASGAAALSRGLHSTQQQSRATAESMTSVASATGTMNKQMGAGKAAFAAFRNAGRGAQFAIIGLIGSVNEAVFMIERTIAANQKVEAAQAEVNRLIGEGKGGTDEYTRAVKDLEEAQRGAQFTSRIMAQSVLDNVTFGGMLASQLPKVVNEYRRLRSGTVEAVAANTSLIASNTGVVASNTAVSASSVAVGRAYTGAIANLGALRAANTATTASNTALAGSMVATAVAAAASIRNLGGYSGALSNLGRINQGVAELNKTKLAPSFAEIALSLIGLDSLYNKLHGSTGRLAAIKNTLVAAGTRLVNVFKFLAPVGTAIVTAFKALPAVLGGTVAGFSALSAAASSLAGGLTGTLIGTELYMQNAFNIQTANDTIARSLDKVIPGFYEFARARDAENRAGIAWLQQQAKAIPVLGDWIRANEQARNTAQNAIPEVYRLADGAEVSKEKFEEYTEIMQKWRDEMGLGVQSMEQMTSVMTQAVTEAFDIQPIEQFLGQGVDRLIQGIDELNTRHLIDPNKAVELKQFLSSGQEALEQFSAHIKDPALWELPLDQFFANILQVEQMTADMPGIVQENIKPLIDNVLSEFNRLAEEGQFIGEDVQRIMKAVATGLIPQDLVERFPELTAHITNVSIALNKLGLDSSQVAQVMQSILGPMAQTGQLIEAGITQPTAELTQALANLEIAGENAAATQERIAASFKFVGDALTGLNEESLINVRNNEQIVASARIMGQSFNEAAVGMAAQVSGLQTWRDELAQAYFNIVETATALGFIGAITRENIPAMLQYTATQERQNEVNEAAVEGYFSLSKSQQQAIDSSGEMAVRLGEVAIKAQDVTAADAALIAEQVKLSEANQQAAQTYIELDESQRQYLESMGITPALIDAVIQGDATLTDAQIELIETQGKLVEETDAYREAINALIPEVQAYAQALGLIRESGEQATLVDQAIVENLQGMDSQYKSTVQSAVDFAAAQGRIGEISGMTVEELAFFIATMEDVGPTAEQMAEIQAQAAERMKEEWLSSFEAIKSAQSEFAGSMRSALGKMGEELGEEMEVGLSDIEKKVAKGFVGFSDQFFDEIFPEDFLATAIIEGNSPDDIRDELEDLMNDVVDEEIVTKEQAQQLIQPLIDYFGENLPEDLDLEKPIGQIAAELPFLLEKLKPAFLNGIIPVGAEAKDAIKTHILDPMIEGLNELPPGASGLQFGRNFLGIIQNNLGTIRQQAGDDVADFIGGILNSTYLTTDEKVQAIISTLGQINPAWADMIMKMDRDSDGFADILDDDVMTPAEQMRDGILDAFEVIFEALGMTDALANLRGLREEMQRTRDAANALGISTGQYKSEVEQLTGAFGMTTSEAENLRNNFDGFNESTGAGIRLAGEWKEAIENSSGTRRQWLINTYEAITGNDLFEDGLESVTTAAEDTVDPLNDAADGAGNVNTQMTNAGGAAATAAGQFRITTEALNAMNQAFAAAGSTTRVVAKPEHRLPTQAFWGNMSGRGGAVGGFAVETGRTREEVAGGGGGGAAATVVDPYLEKLQQLSQEANKIIPQIEAMWTSHFNNTGTQMATFISGSLNILQQEYLLFQSHVPPILTAMELAWANHLANNSAQINAFIMGPLTQLAGAYTLYQTNVVPILQAMELAWTNHLANNGAQITAFITGPLTLLAQAYTLYQTNVVPILQGMELAWTNHLANNTAQINAFLTGPLTLLSQTYTALSTYALTYLTQMSIYWLAHSTSVTTSIGLINAQIGLLNTMMAATATQILTQTTLMSAYWLAHYTSVTTSIGQINIQLGLLNSFLVATATQVLTQTTQMSAHWLSHSNSLGSTVNTLVSHMGTYGSTAAATRATILTQTTQMSVHWSSHEQAVGSIARQIADHIDQLASDIASSMSDIVSSMGEAESAAESLKSAIDALEDKTITVTTRYVTRGSPGGGNQSAQHGFEGIISRPTRFLVGEGYEPEFVSVTPLSGRNKRGNPATREYFDRLKADTQATEMTVSSKEFERAGSGGIGSSSSLSPGPANSGLKRPDITRAAVRKKTTLNAFFEDVLTYEEEQDYRRILKKLEKKKWKVSKLSDEDEERLNEIEDKILQARYDELQRIKQAMSQVQRQIKTLTVDLKSDEELEKWVTTVIPPLSAAPLSMHSSAVTAMSVRGRYQHHRDAMKAGRRAELQWMEDEYERQQKLIAELEEKRLKEEEERDQWLLEHGSKKEKKEAKKRIKQRKEEQRRKLLLDRGTRRDLGYAYAIDRYYKDLATTAEKPVPVTVPIEPKEDGGGATVPISSDSDNDDGGPKTVKVKPVKAKRGFHGIVKKRTNFTVGEFGKKERVDVTPLGERFRTQAEEIRKEVRHFVSGLLTAAGGLNANMQAQGNVVHFEGKVDLPIEVKMFDNSTVTKRELRKLLVDGYTSYR